jgi:hypothetical protein
LAASAPGWPQDDNTRLIAEWDRLAASDIDPDRPASIPGVPTNLVDGTAAVPDCEAAAKVAANDRRIIFQLGGAYFAAKDYENARAQYRRADELGSLMATNNLGHLVTAGLGGPPGLVEGRQLFEKATAGGVALAMWNRPHRLSLRAGRCQGAGRLATRTGAARSAGERRSP